MRARRLLESPTASGLTRFIRVFLSAVGDLCSSKLYAEEGTRIKGRNWWARALGLQREAQDDGGTSGASGIPSARVGGLSFGSSMIPAVSVVAGSMYSLGCLGRVKSPIGRRGPWLFTRGVAFSWRPSGHEVGNSREDALITR